jgi:hypothetical protein
VRDECCVVCVCMDKQTNNNSLAFHACPLDTTRSAGQNKTGCSVVSIFPGSGVEELRLDIILLRRGKLRRKLKGKKG